MYNILGWKNRLEEDEKKRLKVYRKAKIVSQKAAEILVEKFGANKVYLIGSLKSKDEFQQASDIDLVVEGLKAEKYFKALSFIWGLLPKGMKLDLIPLEETDGYFRSNILEEGIILYDKKRVISSKKTD